jgi:hypothetical protein
MTIRNTLRVLTVVAALAMPVATVDAQYTNLTSRSQVGGSGLIDWTQAGTVFSFLSNPFSVAVAGTSLTAAVAGQYGPSQIFQQKFMSWNGNFSANEYVLGPQNFFNRGDLTITFGGQAVSAFGANYQANYFGTFTSRVSVLDALGNVQYSYDFSGTSNANGDGSAVFAGIASNAVNIYGIRFTGLTATLNPGSFAINNVSVNTSVVPEPSAFVLLSTGLAALGVVARRRRQAVLS